MKCFFFLFSYEISNYFRTNYRFLQILAKTKPKEFCFWRPTYAGQLKFRFENETIQGVLVKFAIEHHMNNVFRRILVESQYWAEPHPDRPGCLKKLHDYGRRRVFTQQSLDGAFHKNAVFLAVAAENVGTHFLP